ncbi:tetratricopeptide repeat protein [Lentzea sp. BCCO 10_0798]|uniref:Tetratricopeptide repeat protein n=1 Tax=Lentzea kristufekii TaxID=3095430 RepID=A0ABU4U9L5_9PSEU|nr:tetratricopeptide repeat protein [Lentzea sp. BCCO 10_0798]MDX8056641.1 tetratricopeptide repeat protein [Lentzea sp. BCCO 10_0798]
MRVEFPSAGRAVVSPDAQDLAVLDEQAREELRWYVEDYLRAPFGVYAERGPQVAAKLREWGQNLLRLIFSDFVDGYQSLRADSAAEIVLRSDSAEWLGLPWELCADPARPAPLAVDGVRFTRVVESAEQIPPSFVEGERLRVLMVISRPAGQRDVAFRSIARPMLDAINDQADIVVLRPPTLDRLADELTAARAAGRPFQIVHLDCHGEFGGNEATLLFERPGKGAERVRASQLSQVLAAAQVPVVVLNACHSGAVGTTLEAAVATRLIKAGAAAVVAMAYAVYAKAAAEFMTGFYAVLFSGGSVSEAVAAGRARMALHPERPSPAGQLPLHDWFVPVLYARGEVRFTYIDVPEVSRPADDPLSEVGVFIGRDVEFHRFESAAPVSKAIVLHGPAGVGKSELAKALGRWWRTTGGVRAPEHVVWHSFESGEQSSGADRVVSTIGLQVLGTSFGSFDDERRRQIVDGLLLRERLLVIWDNFEAVTDEHVPKLRELVEGAGNSVFLITSRGPEGRLGELVRIELAGLSPEDAAAYTDMVLAPFPRAWPRRRTTAFQDLLAWLDGHPFAMRLVLPHVDTTEPGEVLAGLRGLVDLPVRYGEGRLGSLEASIVYSTSRLPDRSQELLLAVALFQVVIDHDVLALLSVHTATPQRLLDVSLEEWRELLQDATAVGLLSDLGGGIHRLHPALPGFFLGRWHALTSDASTEVVSARRAMVDAMAMLARWAYEQILGADALIGHGVAFYHSANLSQALRDALDGRLWAQAMALGLLMNERWGWSGRSDEARMWTDRVRLAVEDDDGNPPSDHDSGSSLWLFFVGNHLNRSPGENAEELYRKVIATLLDQPENIHRQRQLAVAYSGLSAILRSLGRFDEARTLLDEVLELSRSLNYPQGVSSVYYFYGDIAVSLGRWDEAEQWYTRSSEESGAAGDLSGVAHADQALGKIFWMRQDWPLAERQYDKALKIRTRLGDLPGTAATLQALGEVALYRGDFAQAEERLRESLVMRERISDRSAAAAVCYILGELASRREQWDEANNWLQRTLPVCTAVADHSGLGLSHHALGRIAESRGDLTQADVWYRRALADFTATNAPLGVCSSHGALSATAEKRGDTSTALDHLVRGVTAFDDFPVDGMGPAPEHLRSLTQRVGVHALERSWLRVTGVALPDHVRAFVTS